MAKPITVFSNTHSLVFDKYNLKLAVVLICPNNVSRLWCLISSDLLFNVLNISRQFLSICVSMHGKFLNIAKVYSANDYTARRSLWKNLSNLQDSWCIIGDFNTLLASDESKGGSIPNQVSCFLFNSWVNSNKLLDMPITSPFFTWSNGKSGTHRIEHKLDHAFVTVIVLSSGIIIDFS